MNKQQGFTSIEALIAIIFLLVLAGLGFAIYIAIHFVMKYW